MVRRRSSFARLVSFVFLFVMLIALPLEASAAAASREETITGRVVDPDARPVAGADVIVVRNGAVIATAKTRGDGRYGPIALPAGAYEIVASAPGLRAAPRRVSLAPGATTEHEVQLAVSAISESVVVSATQVDTPLSRVTASVTILDRTELQQRQIETVSDALRVVPGLGVVTSGGRGALTSLFPRGGESDYTLVLVDGVAHNAFGGGFDAAHLGTADIDRIEVVRGPQSALFGGGAIGSVVHVITRQSGPLTGLAFLEGGGYGTWRGGASTSGSLGVWRWGGAVDRLTTDGDTREVASIGARVTNDDYERVSGSASLGWSDRADRRVRVDVRVDRNERGFPGPYGSDPLDLYTAIDTVSRGRNRTRAVGASGVFAGGGVTHGLQVSHADLQSRFASPFGTSEDETHRVSGRYQADFQLRAIGMSAGWELTHERADNTFITGTLFQPIPVRRLLSGWFVEGRASLGARASLHLGTRVERISRRKLEGDAFGSRPGFEDDVVWSVNPKVSGAWLIRPADESGWTKVRGGAGTGIKPPTAFDIAFTDNPSLKPERSRSFDLGIEHAFLRSHVVADVTWFSNRYNDLIVSVGSSFSGASRYQTDNIANARSRGVEAGVQWQPSSPLRLRAAWTWLDTEILGIDNAPTEAAAPFAVGDPLIRRPRHQASFDIVWSAPRATAFLSANGRGRFADLEPSSGAFGDFDAPGYVNVTIGGSWRLRREVELTGRITNLFDRDYEEAFGFPALGRTAMVGVRVAGSR